MIGHTKNGRIYFDSTPQNISGDVADNGALKHCVPGIGERRRWWSLWRGRGRDDDSQSRSRAAMRVRSASGNAQRNDRDVGNVQFERLSARYISGRIGLMNSTIWTQS